MSSNKEGYIAFGREPDYGVKAEKDRFVNAIEDIKEARDRLREFRFGSRARHTADPGRVSASGSVTDMYVRGSLMVELFRACIGTPELDGQTHLSKNGNYTENSALPSYTIYTSRGDSVPLKEIIYKGAQGTRLELSCESDGPLVASVEWLIKDIETSSTFDPDGRLNASADEMFTYDDLTITRNGQPFPFVESLSITLDNDVQPIEVFNQDPTMVATSFESPALADVQMTITFRDSSTYNEFVANSKAEWIFRWEREKGFIEVRVPQLSIDQWGAPLSGPGRLTVDVYAVAEEMEDGTPAVYWKTAYGALPFFIYKTSQNFEAVSADNNPFALKSSGGQASALATLPTSFDPTQPWALEGWSARTNASTYDPQILWGLKDSSTANEVFVTIATASHVVSFEATNETIPDSNVLVEWGEWNHYRLIWTGTKYQLYFNGVLTIDYTTSSHTPSFDTFMMGVNTYAYGFNRSYSGIVDDIRLWQTPTPPNYSTELTGNESDLVAYYKFDEGSGTTAIDSAGSSDIVDFDNYEYVDDSYTLEGVNVGVPTTGGSATPEKAYSLWFPFTGSVRMPLPSTFDGTQPWTLEAWINQSTGGNVYTYNSHALMNLQDSNTGKEVLLAMIGPSAGTQYLSIHVTGESAVGGSLALSYTAYEHVRLTYDGTTLRAYMNGALSAEVVPTDNFLATVDTLRIGNDSSLSNRNFQGHIDDVRLWQTDSVTADVNTPLIGNETDLLSYYDFDEGSGIFVYDKVTGNTGLISNAIFSLSNPKVFRSNSYIGSWSTITDNYPLSNVSNTRVVKNTEDQLAVLCGADELQATLDNGEVRDCFWYVVVSRSFYSGDVEVFRILNDNTLAREIEIRSDARFLGYLSPNQAGSSSLDSRYLWEEKMVLSMYYKDGIEYFFGINDTIDTRVSISSTYTATPTERLFKLFGSERAIALYETGFYVKQDERGWRNAIKGIMKDWNIGQPYSGADSSFVYDTSTNLTHDGTHLTSWQDVDSKHPPLYIQSGKIEIRPDFDGTIGVVSSNIPLVGELNLDTVTDVYFYVVVNIPTTDAAYGAPNEYFNILTDGSSVRDIGVRYSTSSRQIKGSWGTSNIFSTVHYGYAQKVLVGFYYANGKRYFARNGAIFAFSDQATTIDSVTPKKSRTVNLLSGAEGIVMYEAGYVLDPTQAQVEALEQSLMNKHGIGQPQGTYYIQYDSAINLSVDGAGLVTEWRDTDGNYPLVPSGDYPTYGGSEVTIEAGSTSAGLIGSLPLEGVTYYYMYIVGEPNTFTSNSFEELIAIRIDGDSNINRGFRMTDAVTPSTTYYRTATGTTHTAVANGAFAAGEMRVVSIRVLADGTNQVRSNGNVLDTTSFTAPRLVVDTERLFELLKETPGFRIQAAGFVVNPTLSDVDTLEQSLIDRYVKTPTPYFTYDTATNLTADGSGNLSAWSDTTDAYPLTIPSGISTVTDGDGEVGVVSQSIGLTASLGLESITEAYWYAVIKVPTGSAVAQYFDISADGFRERALGVADSSGGISWEAPSDFGANGTHNLDQRQVIGILYKNDSIEIRKNNTVVTTIATTIDTVSPSTSRNLTLIGGAGGSTLYQAGLIVDPSASFVDTLEQDLMTRYGIT